MSKYVGGFTAPNFRVDVTLGMVIVAGQVVRGESTTGITLGTEEGVKRYLKDCGNVVKVKVINLNTGKDVTKDFIDGLSFVKSRFNSEVVAYRNIYR